MLIKTKDRPDKATFALETLERQSASITGHSRGRVIPRGHFGEGVASRRTGLSFPICGKGRVIALLLRPMWSPDQPEGGCYCFQHKERFGGRAYCLDCQKEF